MLSPEQIEDAAASLHRAEMEREQIVSLSSTHSGATIEDAYAIQAAWMRAKRAHGRKALGWKAFPGHAAVRPAADAVTLHSGVLLDDMFFADGDKIPAARFICPRIGAGFVFQMKRDVFGADVTVFDALNAIDYISPALEVLDSRIVRPPAHAHQAMIDIVSDNAAAAGVILGGRPMRPQDFDMRWAGTIVSRNAVVEGTGLGGAILNDPLRALARLAGGLHRHDDGISAGDMVLVSSLIPPFAFGKGDIVVGDFGRHGSVSCHID